MEDVTFLFWPLLLLQKFDAQSLKEKGASIDKNFATLRQSKHLKLLGKEGKKTINATSKYMAGARVKRCWSHLWAVLKGWTNKGSVCRVNNWLNLSQLKIFNIILRARAPYPEFLYGQDLF